MMMFLVILLAIFASFGSLSKLPKNNNSQHSGIFSTMASKIIAIEVEDMFDQNNKIKLLTASKKQYHFHREK